MIQNSVIESLVPLAVGVLAAPGFRTIAVSEGRKKSNLAVLGK